MFTIPLAPASSKSNFLNKTIWRRLIVTVATVAAALLLTEVLWLMVDRPVSAPLFLVAIVLSSWLNGFRFGFFAAVLGGITIDYFFVQPRFDFSGSRDEIISLLIFVFEGAALAWLTGRLRLAGEQIRASQQKLQALTDYQERLREEEQKRIAREVHDELGQVLSGLKMHIHVLKDQAKTSAASGTPLSAGLDELMDMTDATIATVRRIASELRPPILDDFGLVPAMEWQAQEFERRTSIPCEFKTNSENIDLGPERNSAMYRIVQETLT